MPATPITSRADLEDRVLRAKPHLAALAEIFGSYSATDYGNGECPGMQLFGPAYYVALLDGPHTFRAVPNGRNVLAPVHGIVLAGHIADDDGGAR